LLRKSIFFFVDRDLENSKWKQNFQIENIHQQFNFENPIEEYIEDYQENYGFHEFNDLVASYMEGFLNSNSQLCLHCEKQKYHEFILLLHVPVLTMFQHSEGVKLLEQLLDWLY